MSSKYDNPNLTVCVIYHDEDAEVLMHLLSCIPNKIPVIACKTIKTGTPKPICQLSEQTENVTYYTYSYSKFSFAEARNACKAYAQTDWILSLDADEYVSQYDWENILRFVYGNPPEIGGVMLAVAGWSPKSKINPQTEWLLTPQCRLFRKEAIWVNSIHEQIVESIQNYLHLNITAMDAMIRHFGYAYELDSKKIQDKLNRNLNLLFEELAQKDLSKPNDTKYLINKLNQSIQLYERINYG